MARHQTSAGGTQPREGLRPLILERAGDILAGEGLAAVQARRLASEGNCSVGTLYNLFQDRDGLIVAVNRETLRAMGRPLDAARAATRSMDLEARLLALALAYMAFALGNLNRWLAVFEFRLPEGRDLPDDYMGERARLLGLLEETIGSAVPDANERTLAARALFGAAHGILHLAVNNRLSDFDAAAVEREIRFIVKAAAAGMSGRGRD